MTGTRHVYRTYIKATPAEVWHAIVDPAFTRKYFHGTAFASPPEAGQPYRTEMDGGRPAVEGVIEVCEPPHRFVQTWRVLYDAAMSEEPPSRVEWTLTDAGDGLTRLDLVHGDLARSPLTWANVRDGWVWILESLKSLVETGEPLPSETRNEVARVDDADGEWHRAQGIVCNNTTWEMIEAERTPANDDEMLRRAYASTYHWARAARRTPANDARGVWLLAKVWLIAGRPELSLRYADQCKALCDEHGLVDFDLAYALDAQARAHAALGHGDLAEQLAAVARAVPVADPEDLAILEADLAVPLPVPVAAA